MNCCPPASRLASMPASPRPTLICAALAAAGLLSGLPVLAQTAPKPEEDPSQRIVITANKRAQPQREVAGTVSVVDGAEMERRGARDQEDVLKLTPGVQMNKGDTSSNTITIRGIGTSTTNEGGGGQQLPTGFYVEDVPMVSPSGKGAVPDPLTFDLDRLEVLRGPQGALFGSGSLGGAVRYLYNKPRLGQFDASVQGTYSSVSEGGQKFSLFGMVNVPVNDSTAIRVVAYDRHDPGYIDNLGTGTKDANAVKQRGGRFLVTTKPIKDLSATLVVSSQKTEQGDTFSNSPDPEKLEHTAPNDSRRSVKADFASLTVDWNLGSHTLTSITGWWKNTSSYLIDDTELFASVGLVLPEVRRPGAGSLKATSQELRIASNGSGPLSYVIGAFWQKSSGQSSAAQIDPSAAFGISTLFEGKTTSGGSEKALFADAEYALGGGWSVGVGGRYYRTTTHYFSDDINFGAPTPVAPPDGADNGTTPKASVKYRFGENLWYALAARGYRYGGVNGTSPFSTFKSDKLWNYETGVRLVPATGVQLDLTAFLLDWKDAQFTFFEVAGGLPTSGIANVGKARSKGLEAALRWKATSSIDLNAALAYVDAKTLVDVNVPAGRAVITAPAGSRLPGSARLQTALSAAWRFAGPFETQGRLDGTFTHVGDRVLFLGGNKPAGGFDTLDLGASFARANWTLSAGLANALDERGIMSITGAPGGVGSFAQYFLQKPRTLSVTLRYDY